MHRRKPYGVWLLLMDGTPWMFCVERSVEEALMTARTLRTAGYTSRDRHVWIAHVDRPASVALRGAHPSVILDSLKSSGERA